MRIMFATGLGAGHFGPLVPFAAACGRAGHQVLVAGPEGARRMVERAGFAFHGLGEPRHRAAAWAPVFAPDAPDADYVIQELFVRVDARAALPGMLELTERWRPDLMVRETCEFASCIAAERFDVPLVDVGIHLDAATDASPELGTLAAQALGPSALDRPRTILTCAPASFDSGPSDVHRFRTPAAARIDATYVYVCFGSEVRHLAPFKRAAHALAGIPKRVLMTIGDRHDPAALGALPPNVRAERWITQSAVMPHAAAMVGHGGSGGTLAALAAGVPLALVPMFVDGPANARQVAALGAGIVVDGDLAEAVVALLENPAYRTAAERIADEIRALPRAEHAVELLTRSAAAAVR